VGGAVPLHQLDGEQVGAGVARGSEVRGSVTAVASAARRKEGEKGECRRGAAHAREILPHAIGVPFPLRHQAALARTARLRRSVQFHISSARADATKIDEYVPKITPATMARAKSLITSPPKK